VVVRQLLGVVDDLARVRLAAPDPKPGAMMDPSRGDPFRDFAGFATHMLNLEMVLRVRPGVGLADLERSRGVQLDNVYAGWRASPDEGVQVLERLIGQGPMAVRDLLLQFPVERRRHIELSLAWMAKIGVLDWLG
jgi:hypothetical protein